MSDEFREYESAVAARLTAEFACPERDAERVAEAAGRIRRSEADVDWSAPFLVEKLADAPKAYSVPEKWDWWLAYFGAYTVDLDEYRLTESASDE